MRSRTHVFESSVEVDACAFELRMVKNPSRYGEDIGRTDFGVCWLLLPRSWRARSKEACSRRRVNDLSVPVLNAEAESRRRGMRGRETTGLEGVAWFAKGVRADVG